MSGYGLLFRGIQYAVQGTALGAAAGVTVTDAAAMEARAPAILHSGQQREAWTDNARSMLADMPLTGANPDAAPTDGARPSPVPIAGPSDPGDDALPEADPTARMTMPNGFTGEIGAVAVPLVEGAISPILDAPPPFAPAAVAKPPRISALHQKSAKPPSFDAPSRLAQVSVAQEQGTSTAIGEPSLIAGLEIGAPLSAKRNARPSPSQLGLQSASRPGAIEDNAPRYAAANYEVTPVGVPGTAGVEIDREGDTAARTGQATEGDILKLQTLSRGGLAVSGGYSSIEGPVASVKLARTNIGAPGRDLTLSGRYSKVQALMEMGASDRNFAGSGFAVAPAFFYSRSKAVGFDRNVNSGLFVQTARGLNVYLGRPLTRKLRFAANYRFSDEDFLIRRKNALCDISVHGSVFCNALGRSSSSVLSVALSLDRRDSTVDPRRGFQLRVSQDVAGLGGDTRFVRYRASATFYQRLGDNIDLALGLEGGYASGYDGRDVPLFDRFYIGGNSMRGFDLRGLGPKVVPAGASPDKATAIGGEAYYVGRAELSFRLTGDNQRFGAVPSVFVDAGSVFGARKSELAAGEMLIGNSATPRAAVGIGMTFNLAPGKLRFSVAQPVKRQQGDRSKIFAISFGTAF